MTWNPYALNGHEFLLFYGLALLLIVILSWPWRPRASGAAPVPPERLGLEHWAILMGGVSRAAQATFTRNLQDGSIVWNEAELRYEPGHPDSTDPLANLLRNKARLPHVMKQLERSFASYEKDLQTWGLVLSPDQWSMQHFKLGLYYGFYLMLGLVRVFQGLARDRPVGFLLLFMGLAVGLGIGARRRLQRQTREGQRLLHDFAVKNDHIRRAPPSTELPLAVALGGIAALNGSAMGHFMWAVMPELKKPKSFDERYWERNTLMSGHSGNSGSSGGASGCGGCGGDD